MTQKGKTKRIFLGLLFFLLLILLIYCCARYQQEVKEKVSENQTHVQITNTQEQFNTDEFRLFEGEWLIEEYAGNLAMASGGASTVSEEEYLEYCERVEKDSEQYMGRRLRVIPENIQFFGPPTELGYHYDDLGDPTFGLGQIHVIPPFVVAEIRFYRDDIPYRLVSDSEGNKYVCIWGGAFRLEQVVE